MCQALFGGALILFAGLFFFKEPLLNWGVRSSISRFFPGASFSFHEVHLEKKGVILTQFRMTGRKGEITIPRLFVQCAFKTRPFVFLPHIKVREPQILLKEGAKGFEGILFSSKRLQPSVTIDQGTLLWKNKQLGFSLQSRRGKKGEMHSPYMSCAWKCKRKGLTFDLTLENAPLDLLSPLTQGVGLEISTGEVTFSGKGEILSSLTQLTLEGEGTFQHLNGRDVHRKLSFCAQRGSFSIKESSLLTAQLEEGRVTLETPFHQGQWDFIHLSGEMRRKEGKSFHADVKGALVRDIGGFAWHALAQGSLQEWNADVTFEDQEETKLHLSSDQSGVNISFKECDPLLLDLGQEILSTGNPELLDWEVTEGVASGDWMLKPSGEIDINSLIARDVRIQNFKRRTFCALKKAKVQGGITRAAQISRLNVLFNALDADLIQDDGEIWNLSGVDGTFSMRNGQIAETKIQGTFLGLVGELDIRGPSLFSATQFKLYGGVDQVVSLFSQELSEAYHEHIELPVKISGSVQGDPTSSKVVVDLFVGEKVQSLLHLEATLNETSIETLTFASNRVSHTLYAPLITSIFPSLEIGGEWELSGEYVRGDLTCKMMTKNALVGHAAFPLTFVSDQSSSQATLTGNVLEDRWHLSFPHFKGKLKGSKPFAFTFETTLDISKESGSPWRTQAKLEKGILQIKDRLMLSDLSFDAHFDEKNQTLLCRDVRGAVASDRPLSLVADTVRFSKQGERWAWAAFALSEQQQSPFHGKFEALSNGRNPHSFLLLFQKEQEPPLFFQGKTQGDVWTLDPLPKGDTDE